jgi:hypothetical protein
MLPINIIDELIKFAHHRIDYLRIDLNDKNINIDRWDDGYHSGYIAAMNKYINDLVYLKNRINNINLDDDDV